MNFFIISLLSNCFPDTSSKKKHSNIIPSSSSENNKNNGVNDHMQNFESIILFDKEVGSLTTICEEDEFETDDNISTDYSGEDINIKGTFIQNKIVKPKNNTSSSNYTLITASYARKEYSGAAIISKNKSTSLKELQEKRKIKKVLYRRIKILINKKYKVDLKKTKKLFFFFFIREWKLEDASCFNILFYTLVISIEEIKKNINWIVPFLKQDFSVGNMSNDIGMKYCIYKVKYFKYDKYFTSRLCNSILHLMLNPSDLDLRYRIKNIQFDEVFNFFRLIFNQKKRHKDIPSSDLRNRIETLLLRNQTLKDINNVFIIHKTNRIVFFIVECFITVLRKN